MTRRTATTAAMLVLAMAGWGLVPAAVVAAPACAEPAAGGEWRTYGHDLANTRHQDEETVIGPDRAAALEPVWTLSVADAGGDGDFNHTPIVADGCLYLASSTGWVVAANAETGDVVWKTQLEDPVASSPAVVGGRVFVNVNRPDFPYTVALDQATGALKWRTTIDRQPGSDLFSSPVPFDGMVLAGVSGAGAESGTTFTGNPQSRLGFRGSYVFLDQATGAIVEKGYTIPDEDFAAGYAGGGVWSTAAVDEDAGYAYVGGGNPFTAEEHPYTNAILKIDVDRSRATFGEIVGAYHGAFDQYFDALTSKPVCEAYVDVFTCELQDYDFGASPQLFTDASGRRLVGDQQKSGIYHAADRETMEGVWETVVGGPFGMVGGMGTASYDGTSLFVAGSAPGLMHALDPASGARSWTAPIADGVHFQSSSSANGVTYVIDGNGLLRIWDSATGDELQTRVIGNDAGGGPSGGLQGGGVTVARNTVYVPAGDGLLVAYR